tara:strand:- start:2663 stop:3541 length:879 start_codon:yes stop_codon:yes gene_type:complete
MPKVTYNETKGLFQDSGQAFQVNDAPIIPSADGDSTHASAVYKATFVVDHNGGGAGAPAEAYDNKYLTIEDRDGKVYAFWFRKATSDSTPTVVTDLSAEEVSPVILGNNADKGEADIATALALAVNSGTKSAKKFFAIATAGVVDIYVLATGYLANYPETNTTDNTTGGDVQAAAGGITDCTFVLTSDGVGSGTINAGSTHTTIVQSLKVATVDSQIAIPDGTAIGQEKFITAAALGASVPLTLTGTFYKADASAGTNATTSDNTAVHLAHLIWVGEGKWWFAHTGGFTVNT